MSSRASRPPGASASKPVPKGDVVRRDPRILNVVAAAYVALVLWVTLGPAPWAQTRLAESSLGILNPATWSAPTTWTTGTPFEFVLNIALFVPIGALAYRLPGRALKVIASIALTVLIELLQIPLASRASDPRDLVANVLGAFVGLYLARNLRAIRSGGPSTRRSRSAGWRVRGLRRS